MNVEIRQARCGEKNGAQGRDRTADTAIFSRMLYQLSYLGPRLAAASAGSGRAPLTLVFRPVQPGIGGRTRDAVALAKPSQQVPILAAAAAERCMLRRGRLAA